MKMINKLRHQYLYQYCNLLFVRMSSHSSMEKIAIFDTSLFSDNLGDKIINYYCDKVFKELSINIIKRYPTHAFIEKSEIQKIDERILKIITGTNILDGSIDKFGLWRRPYNNQKLQHLGLMGVGWSGYEDKINKFSKMFYCKLLDKAFIHSVRDRYTEQKLKSIGINNVIFTSCPTMWNLNSEHCEKIPKTKSDDVVTTITDYAQDPEKDWAMLNILLRNYNKVYLWIQGDSDLDYIKNYNHREQIILIDNSLDAYNRLLDKEELDYVGTRLHAGIHALNKYKRSIIISIDNRAKEISKDTNLPIVERDKVELELEDKINSLFSTEIYLPLDNIKIWKKQFVNSDYEK